jgi:hypothetical protein
MGGDFDKGGPSLGLGLGLREAIKKAVAKKKAAEEKKKAEEKAAKKKTEDELNLCVESLFDEMKIIENVSLAVFEGHSSVTIEFPWDWQGRFENGAIITPSLVVEHMVKKIKEENLGVLVQRNPHAEQGNDFYKLELSKLDLEEEDATAGFEGLGSLFG